MKHSFGALILSALICPACADDSSRADHGLVIDSGWPLAYANYSCLQVAEWYRRHRDDIKQLGCNAVTSCQENMSRVNACASDPGREVLHFFGQLTTQLASNTQCKGVQVTAYDMNSTISPALADILGAPHSWLNVDYTPGSPKQGWRLVSEGGTYMEGEGAPEEIAASICTILGEHGARVVK